MSEFLPVKMIDDAIRMIETIITAAQQKGLQDDGVISMIKHFQTFLRNHPFFHSILTDSTIVDNAPQQTVLEWFDSVSQSLISRKDAISDSLHAASIGNLDFIKNQPRQGINDLLDVCNNDGNTALMLAIMNKDDRMVDEILNQTPKDMIERVLAHRNNSMFTPLMLIACRPLCIYIVNNEVKKTIFKEDFDMVEKTANVYKTILKHTPSNESLKRILNEKREGKTMLMQMAERDDDGAMVNMILMNTPSEILGDVLSAGTDETALQIAIKKGHESIANVISNYMQVHEHPMIIGMIPWILL